MLKKLLEGIRLKSTLEITTEIQQKLGFVPPFFTPAFSSPNVLENLWVQTTSAYLDSPIPALFKEKLSALLARYCSVPYCLICHSSTLRPLGMKAREVLELLQKAPLTTRELELLIKGYVGQGKDNLPLASWPQENSELETFILHCSVAIFLHLEPNECHATLRRILPQTYYDYLLLFIAYNRTCLSWAEGHPELAEAFQSDKRAQDNLAPMIEEEPQLAAFFKDYKEKVRAHEDHRLCWLTEENKRLLQVEREMINSLNGTISELEEDKNIIQRFVHTISHDLRNPLSVIRMNVRILMKKLSNDEGLMKFLRHSYKCIIRIDRMIDDILDASKIRAGEQLALEMVHTNLEEFIEEVIEDQVTVYGDRFKFVAPEDSVYALINQEGMRRVLENLLANAVKHGDPELPISIYLTRKSGEVIVSVQNFGKVLSLSEQEAIFNPFFRASPDSKGWGIGLTVVKGLVQSHKGKIQVQSSNTLGTIFTIEIPEGGEQRSTAPLIDSVI